MNSIDEAFILDFFHYPILQQSRSEYLVDFDHICFGAGIPQTREGAT
jgi:hypothetical protein